MHRYLHPIPEVNQEFVGGLGHQDRIDHKVNVGLVIELELVSRATVINKHYPDTFWGRDLDQFHVIYQPGYSQKR